MHKASIIMIMPVNTIWIILAMLYLVCFSSELEMQVRLTFDEPESGVTIIKLKQTDVPEEDKYVD